MTNILKFKAVKVVLILLGVIFTLLLGLLLSLGGEFLLWQYDALRDWEFRHQTQIPPYEVTLVQEPGMDFYNSYFEIRREDGKVGFVLIDGDDSKWRNLKVIPQNGKVYFVRDEGLIDKRTTYIDPTSGIVFSGNYQRGFNISDLEFTDEQSLQRDFVGKPDSQEVIP